MVGTFGLMAGQVVWAQALDGGRILDSLRDRPGAPAAPIGPPVPRPEIERPAVEAPAVAPGGPKIHISGFEFVGNSVLSSQKLDAELADYLGRDADFAALTDAALRITRFYRARGYLVARAVLLPQQPTNGKVRINIAEGLLGEVKLDRAPGLRLTDATVERFLRQLNRGAPIREDELERTLLLLAQVDGARVRASLSPGRQSGTADLLVQVVEGPAIDTRVEVDNYGSRATGPLRATGRMGIHDYFGHGENFELRATTSFEGLNATSAEASVPIVGNGLRIGAYLTRVEYRIGKDLAQLSANGNATLGGGYLDYTLLRGRNANINARFGLETRRFIDRIEFTGTMTAKKSDYGSFTLAGDWRDSLLAGARNTWSLRAGHGTLRRESPDDAANDALTARTAGRYSKTEFSFSREQFLGGGFSLYGAALGQSANRNLDSTEKFYLGGPFGVRAYPQGEGAGDEGVLGTLELRKAFAGPAGARMQASVFTDVGEVRLNKNPWDPAQQANNRTLRGSGVGLSWALSRAAAISAGLAWRHGNAPTVEADRSPRLWMQVSLAPQALAGPAALPELGAEAYAATRSELYGNLGVMLEHVMRDGAASVAPSRMATQALTPTGQNLPAYNHVRDNFSYIGVRGGVPIGSGPEVFYQVEASIAYTWNFDGRDDSTMPASAAPNTAWRESAIGLRGTGWGSLFYGQWDMPIKEVLLDFDPFANSSMGSNFNLIGSPGFGVAGATGAGPASHAADAVNDDATFNRRQGAVLQYWTPEWHGLTVRVAYSDSHRRVAPDVDFGRLWGATALYKLGGLTTALGYERHDNYFGIASLGRNNRGVGSDTALTAGTSSLDYTWRAGVMYNFGATTVGVTADWLAYRESGVLPFNTVPDLSRYQRAAWVANLTHKIGAWDLKAGYGRANAGYCEVIINDPTQQGCTAQGLGARHLALGFNYALRKGIDIFGHAARIYNNQSSSYNFNVTGVLAGANASPGVGADPKGFGVGVRYTF